MAHGPSTALRFTVAQGLLVAAEVVLECCRDCVLLERLTPTGLPWIYLAITSLVLLTAFLQSRARGRSTDWLARLLAGAGAMTFGLWWFWSDGLWLLAALSLGTALFSAVLFVQLTFRADGYGWSDRPRSFSLIAAGGPMGALVGAGVSRLALHVSTPRLLLLISSALSLGAVALVASLPDRRAEAEAGNRDPAPDPANGGPAGVRALRPLVAVAVLAALAGALADFIFKQRLMSELPFARIPPLLANARVGQAALSLGLQVVAARWLLRRRGVARGLILLPAGLFLVSQGMSVGGEVALCLLARVLEGGLRRSIEPGSAGARRTGTRRRWGRDTTDVVSQRLGQTAAMGVVVTATAARLPPAGVVAVLAMASVAWLEGGRRVPRRRAGRQNREKPASVHFTPLAVPPR